MKRSTAAFLLVFLLLGLYVSHDSDWGKSLFRGIVANDEGIIKKKSLSFMEDIRFKDFEKAAAYHHPEDLERVDIPRLIERLFQIKPEFLDIMTYDIMDAGLDSTGKRGRVKLKAKVNLLNSGKIKNPEFILYFHKRENTWYMELESSLR